MKFTIKTLQQKSFQIEADPSVKVSEFKYLIQTSQGFPTEHQKLIFSGKILADDCPMSQYNIAEKDFLVVMVAKPKVVASTSAAAAAVPAPVAVTPVAPAPSPVAAPIPAASSVPATSAAPASTAFDASTLATGASYNHAVESLIEMGFPRDQVVAAMRAAFNNPDRAAEYLMTGIPENARGDAPPASAASPASVGNASSPAAPPSGNPMNMFEAGSAAATTPSAPTSASTDAAFEAIRNSPQFQQLRQLVQTQPQLLQPILQQLGQSNPELLQIIGQNPEAFMRLLGIEDSAEEGYEGEDVEGGPVTVTISPEENEAIERLVALGFERNVAIEAYLACDKNEELAANYLFDTQF